MQVCIHRSLMQASSTPSTFGTSYLLVRPVPRCLSMQQHHVLNYHSKLITSSKSQQTHRPPWHLHPLITCCIVQVHCPEWLSMGGPRIQWVMVTFTTEFNKTLWTPIVIQNVMAMWLLHWIILTSIADERSNYYFNITSCICRETASIWLKGFESERMIWINLGYFIP